MLPFKEWFSKLKKRCPEPEKRFDIVIQYADGTAECFPYVTNVSNTEDRLSFTDINGKLHIRSNKNSAYEEIRIHEIKNSKYEEIRIYEI